MTSPMTLRLNISLSERLLSSGFAILHWPRVSDSHFLASMQDSQGIHERENSGNSSGTGWGPTLASAGLTDLWSHMITVDLFSLRSSRNIPLEEDPSMSIWALWSAVYKLCVLIPVPEQLVWCFSTATTFFSWSTSWILSMSYGPAQLLSLHGKGQEEGSNAGPQIGPASIYLFFLLSSSIS